MDEQRGSGETRLDAQGSQATGGLESALLQPAQAAAGANVVPPFAAPHSWSLSTAAAAPAPCDAALRPPLGTAAWQQALGQQLIFLSQAGLGSAELQLNPLELGPLKVNLQLVEGGLAAQFSAEQATVREAVQAALPQLRSALAEQGMSLGQAQIDAGSRHSSQEHERMPPEPRQARQMPKPALASAVLPPAPAAQGGLRAWA